LLAIRSQIWWQSARQLGGNPLASLVAARSPKGGNPLAQLGGEPLVNLVATGHMVAIRSPSLVATR
jgi:hypothetical protein